MRVILSFFAGLLILFYLSETVYRLGSRFKSISHTLKLNHSIPGLLLFVSGLTGAILFSSSPTYSMISFFILGAGLGLVSHHLLSQRYILFERLEHSFVKKHENAFERSLEILPGALLWLAITSPIWLSFALPFAVAYLILVADAYWLFNALKIGVLIIIGYYKMEWAKKQNWLGKLKEDHPNEWDKYYHLILIPTYQEPVYILSPAFDAITNSAYPKDKIFLAVGFEGRDDPEKIKESTRYLESKIAKKIGGAFSTIHPYGLPGEVAGPGSNRNWMVRNAVKEFKKRGIKPEQVFVTTLDADFVIHPQFLAGALYKYLSLPPQVRNKHSFTGVFLYHNNYWETPSPMRLMATGTSFWQLAEMVGSDKYINYSSMSINLKSLLDIGLWMPDKVNDDWGFYFKAYFHFNGKYKVTPHFLPISADAVQDTTLLKTFQNQYLQMKRWAYGVEHVPFLVKQYFTKEVDFWDKTDKVFFVLWGYLKWGFMALFITFGALIIPLVNPNFRTSVVSVNLPIVSSWILTAAFLGLFATIYVHEKTAPPRPADWSFLRKLWSYIQWALMPIILVTISSLPAIDAQTTLMLGKHLEFRVTRKARVAAESGGDKPK